MENESQGKDKEGIGGQERHKGKLKRILIDEEDEEEEERGRTEEEEEEAGMEVDVSEGNEEEEEVAPRRRHSETQTSADVTVSSRHAAGSRDGTAVSASPRQRSSKGIDRSNTAGAVSGSRISRGLQRIMMGGLSAADVALLPPVARKKQLVSKPKEQQGRGAKAAARRPFTASPESKAFVESIRSEASGKVTKESVLATIFIPLIYKSGGDTFSMSIPTSKLESLVNAKLKAKNIIRLGNHSPEAIQQARMVYPPENDVIIQKVYDSLRVYLSPFLHGRRYTSFGRHFTVKEKLAAVAKILEPYMTDGDVLVDMCCGSNDFSVLAKQRLCEVGKTRCGFRNFDIEPPAQKFNFELRDWMTVQVSHVRFCSAKLTLLLKLLLSDAAA